MAQIVVCTPMYGGTCYSDYFVSMIRLKDLAYLSGHKIEVLTISNESLIHRGRNSITWMAFKHWPNLDYIVFIDADIGFNPADLLKMVEADKDIIGGIYPKKSINWNDIFKAKDKNINKPFDSFGGNFVIDYEDRPERIFFDKPLEVKHIGTGFMLVKASVFEKLKTTVGSYISDSAEIDGGQRVFNYFQTPVVNNRLLSEDYFFCYAYKNIGGKVYAAPWCNFKHNGTYKFSGSYVESLKLNDDSFYNKNVESNVSVSAEPTDG